MTTYGGRGERLRGWRRIAGATWGRPSDPQIYGDLDVDAAALLELIARTRDTSGARVTVTSLVGKAVAHALAEHPDLNVHLRGGRAVRRDSVDVFFQVTSDGGRDLSGAVVRAVDTKTAAQVTSELTDAATRLAGGERVGLRRSASLLDRVPRPLLRPALRVAGWLVNDRGVDLGRLGLPRQPFGGVMVSSVGMFGIERAHAPLASYYGVPALVLVGAVTQRPVAVAGQVVVRPVLPLGITLDHRYLDGHQAGRLAASIRAYCADPGRFEP